MRSTLALLFVLTLFAAPFTADEAAAGHLARIEIQTADVLGTRAVLEELGYDVAAHDRVAGRVEVIAPASELTNLRAFGAARVVELSRPFREIQEELAPGLAPDDRYKTYGEVVSALNAIEAAHPSIARVVDMTSELGTSPTWEGRHIVAMKISDNVDVDEDEPTVLFDSLHHARELNTIEVALDIVDKLTGFYDQNQRVKDWVDSLEIWVVPVVNPDGLEFVWSDEQFWRKNRRDNGGGIFGVDLNRNYPFQWGECGNNSGDPDSDVYRGPAPLSEPEVQTILALADSIRPVIYNSYHSSGQEVLPPYVCADLAEAPLIDTVREVYRERMDYEWRVASSSGESFEWFYNQVSSIGFLTEIGTQFQPPFEETEAEVERVRPGWAFLLDAMLAGPLVTGNVTDALSGLPVEASLTSDRVDFTEGERRSSDPEEGRYGWFLAPGNHFLSFTAPGYEPLTVLVDSVAGGVELDVALDPEP